VVTAMGIKRSAKALGYSATAVKGDDITAARTNDIMSSLAGKVAGVQIAESSSDPGSSKSVIIRGVSSLSGNNQPLYIVDGVPMNNSATFSDDGLNSGFDFGNGASAVNPDDVESMTILKGAAATALYGSRAGNGVILITTKKGAKQARGVGIEYNGGLQWESVLRLPQTQNRFGMGWYGDKTDIENGSWGPEMDGSMLRYGWIYDVVNGSEWDYTQKVKSYVPIKDNMKDFFDTGFRFNNSLSYNGATDKSTYYLSLSQISDNGIIPTNRDSYDKYTFSARGSHREGHVTFSTSLNYAFQRNKFVTTGQGTTSMYNAIMQTPRDISIAELKDLNDPFNSPGYYYTPYGVTNPYWILENYQNNFEQERFYGNFEVRYDFLKYFNLTYRFGMDTNTSQHDMGEPNLSKLFAGTPNAADNLDKLTGLVSQQTSRRREMDHNLMLTYDQQINNDWRVNASIGFNGNERRYSYLFGSVTNLTIPTWFNLSNSAEIPTVEQYQWKRRYMGLYGTAEVDYKNFLFLTLNLRNDWSSTLPKGNRSFFYPGITASFLFSELLTPEAREILSFGKLRAAWGKTGNDASVYMTNSVYAQAAASSSGWGNSSFPFTKTGTNAFTAGNVLGSMNLSPEMTTEAEVGLQLAFFQNRLSFDISYYNRNTDKQIFPLNMDPATGYTAQNMNLGKINNKGVEILVTATPVKIGDFSWDVSWNFTKNKSKVVSLPEELGGIAQIYGFSEGTGMYAITGEPLGVFKAYVPYLTEDGKIVCDAKKGLPIRNPEQQIVGNMNYKYQMGFGTTLRYKGVSLSAALDIRKGGVMFSRTKDIMYFTGNAIQTAYNGRSPFIIPNSVKAIQDDEGNITGYTENDIALDESTIFEYWDAGGDKLDAAFLVDKSYVKLRNVVLTWDLPSKWFAKTFLTGVSISAFGNNLFVWTPKSNTFIDPEITSFGNDLEGNFGEYSANPSSRKFGFNLKVKF
ncbi:MAG: SusC/RagA family TonB-linked outer membrane protein, partial [Muribaculaceae bacterium]|nr:SusC/RagA family TonB-linked outer membrane protein [Muribaculaceae bacterium]